MPVLYLDRGGQLSRRAGRDDRPAAQYVRPPTTTPPDTLARLGSTTDTAVKESRYRVDFADDGRQCDLVIWASGVGGRSGCWLGYRWDAPDASWSTRTCGGHDDIYGAGDLSSATTTRSRARPASHQNGRVGCCNIIIPTRRPRQEFVYNDKGTMATIGRNAAVVQFPRGPRLTGFIAWLLWVVVHLMTLLGGRNRVSAMINLGVRYFAWPRSAAGIVGDFQESPAQLSRGETTRE